MKSTIQNKAAEIYDRLYPARINAASSSMPPPSSASEDVEETTVTQTLFDKLQKAVAESTQEMPQMPEASLIPDFKMFEATRKRTEKLELLYRALLTIKPTSVESERAFSLGGSFATKVRSRLHPKTLSALVSLKAYFKGQRV